MLGSFFFSLIFPDSLTSKFVCFVHEGCSKGKHKFNNEKSFNAADLLLSINLIPIMEAVLTWKVLISLNTGVEKKSVLVQEVQLSTKTTVKIFIFQQLYSCISDIAGHAQINAVLQFFHSCNYVAFWGLWEVFLSWRCIVRLLNSMSSSGKTIFWQLELIWKWFSFSQKFWWYHDSKSLWATISFASTSNFFYNFNIWLPFVHFVETFTGTGSSHLHRKL